MCCYPHRAHGGPLSGSSIYADDTSLQFDDVTTLSDRPALNTDIIRRLVTAQNGQSALNLCTLISNQFGGISHLVCMPELAKTNKVEAESTHHSMLPVLLTVVFAPKAENGTTALTVGDLLENSDVRAAWAKLRAEQPTGTALLLLCFCF